MILVKKYSRLSDSRKNIIKNLFWAILGKVVNVLGALFVGILVARYLGPSQYGLMNYVISYVTIFMVLSAFGLDNIEIRELSRKKGRENEILGTTFTLRIIFSLITLLLEIVTLIIYKADSYTTLLIIIYSISIFMSSFNVIRNYFTSIVQNEFIVKTEISRTVIGALIKIILLWHKAPLILFIIAAGFDTILVASGYVIGYRKVGTIMEWRYNKSLVPFLLKESFPLLLSGAAIIIYQKIDQVMIGNMLDNKSVGFFATAGKFVDVVLYIPMVLAQTLTPLLVRVKETDLISYNIKKQQFLDIILWVSIILSLLTSLLAYYIIKFTFGSYYLAAVPILQIMVWKTVGMALSVSSGQLMIMEHIQKMSVIRNIVGCALCVILNYLLIPVLGIIGSAWVTIITVIVSGYIVNAFIPAYREIFKSQCKSVLWGWKSLYNFRKY